MASRSVYSPNAKAFEVLVAYIFSDVKFLEMILRCDLTPSATALNYGTM
jgi:hypothetical protein